MKWCNWMCFRLLPQTSGGSSCLNYSLFADAYFSFIRCLCFYILSWVICVGEFLQYYIFIAWHTIDEYESMFPCSHIYNTHAHREVTSCHKCHALQNGKSLLASKIQFSHTLGRADSWARYVCLRLNNSCRFITLWRQTKPDRLLHFPPIILLLSSNDNFKKTLFQSRDITPLQASLQWGFYLFQFHQFSRFTFHFETTTVTPWRCWGSTHRQEAPLHLSWLRVVWLDFTEPEDGVRVCWMCESQCVLEEVRADGVDFRDQESRG